MTTADIKDAVAGGNLFFRVSNWGPHNKVELLEAGVMQGSHRQHNRRASGVRVKFLTGSRAGEELELSSRDIQAVWTKRDEEYLRNRLQREVIEQRINEQFRQRGYGTSARDGRVAKVVASTGDESTRQLQLTFAGNDADKLMGTLGIPYDISFEQAGN